MSNHVLIKVRLNNKLKLNTGQELYLETVFNPQDHVPVTGEVVKVPETLYYNQKDKSESLQWKTHMEVLPGDIAFFEYFAALMALAGKVDPAQQYQEPKYLEYKGELYIFLKYDALMFVKREEKIIPVNGFMICEPIEKELKTSSNLILPKSLQKKESNKFAKVYYVGSTNDEYLDGKYKDVEDIKPGNIILFSPYANQRVEYSLHQKFSLKKREKEKYIVVQRRWVRGVFPAEFENNVRTGQLK